MQEIRVNLGMMFGKLKAQSKAESERVRLELTKLARPIEPIGAADPSKFHGDETPGADQQRSGGGKSIHGLLRPSLRPTTTGDLTETAAIGPQPPKLGRSTEAAATKAAQLFRNPFDIERNILLPQLAQVM